MSSATAAQPEKLGTQSPAYVAYGTFKNFVGYLSDHGLPTRIDKSVMEGMSGGTKSHLSSALKFLNLVGSDGSPQAALKELVDGHGDEQAWQRVLKEIVDAAYAEIASGLDITKASPLELDKRFQDRKLSGVMLDKSVRFYVSAMKDAGVPVSPHIAKRKSRAPRNGTGKAKKQEKPAANSSDTEKKPLRNSNDKTPSGMLDYPLHLPNGRQGLIRVPSDVTAEDIKMIELTVPLLKAYAGIN